MRSNKSKGKILVLVAGIIWIFPTFSPWEVSGQTYPDKPITIQKGGRGIPLAGLARPSSALGDPDFSSASLEVLEVRRV